MDILSKRSIRDKIMAYLAAQADAYKSYRFEIPLNRNELADFLCIDRSAMSRELGKLRDDGIIDYHKNSFLLLNYSNNSK
jgi:CRP-like cAMP-binding protein